jgi:hypothetical protein
MIFVFLFSTLFLFFVTLLGPFFLLMLNWKAVDWRWEFAQASICHIAHHALNLEAVLCCVPSSYERAKSKPTFKEDLIYPARWRPYIVCWVSLFCLSHHVRGPHIFFIDSSNSVFFFNPIQPCRHCLTRTPFQLQGFAHGSLGSYRTEVMDVQGPNLFCIYFFVFQSVMIPFFYQDL